MTTQSRRQWSAEEKLRVIEEARQAGQSISEVCRRHQLATTQFYIWEKQAREGAVTALNSRRRGPKVDSIEVRQQAEINRLRAVIAELSAENLQLKRGSGHERPSSVRRRTESPASGDGATSPVP